MKHTLITLTACLLLCAQAFTAAAESRSEAKTAGGNPNIIYILCDDLGYGDVKCLGGDRSKMPRAA
jgi:hypothetical protein